MSTNNDVEASSTTSDSDSVVVVSSSSEEKYPKIQQREGALQGPMATAAGPTNSSISASSSTASSRHAPQPEAERDQQPLEPSRLHHVNNEQGFVPEGMRNPVHLKLNPHAPVFVPHPSFSPPIPQMSQPGPDFHKSTNANGYSQNTANGSCHIPPPPFSFAAPHGDQNAIPFGFPPVFMMGSYNVGSQNHPMYDPGLVGDYDYTQGQASHSDGLNQRNQNQRPRRPNKAQVGGRKKDEESQDTLRVRLAEQLEDESCECMVCCDRILVHHWTWSCTNCYQIFHLRCIKKWASKSLQEDGVWRCPGCQDVNSSCPTEYVCFCGKVPNPKYRRGDNTPHACTEACRKGRAGGCPHKCTLPCHPGPCPPCPRTLKVKCSCGAEEKTARCGTLQEYKCQKVCGEVLNCQVHKCPVVCHSGACKPCQEMINQRCFCGKGEREVPCTVENGERTGYGCGDVCSKALGCGNHTCTRLCHDGECDQECPLAPDVLKRCPCGSVELSTLSAQPRTSCTDPVPLCGNNCGKRLGCGTGDKVHYCSGVCHAGKCPPCPEMTSRRCRCGGSSKSILCSELAQFNESNPLLCERRCKKTRSCRLHKCGNLCCVEREHLCMQVCGKPLTCRQHLCDSLCHSGKCPPCLRASFTELFCECGETVLHPPVACGARPPPCDMPCSREHPCSHPVTHKCHSEDSCPPCTHLTSKWCYGHHELRRNIPCFLDDVSCGKPCGRKLGCGHHFCMKTCHAGACMEPGEKCKYPCPLPREECSHPCKALCHDGPCPETPCKHMVKVRCKCGNRQGEMSCVDLDKHYKRQVAAKAMATTDPTRLHRQESTEKLRSLECTDECGRIERNRSLAEALNVRTGDFVGERSPVYTDFLKGVCLVDRALILRIEKAMVDLVQGLEQTKAGFKAHVFQPMNRDHRRAIHEYADYFQIETESYDPEPQRNVVLTARKGKSSIPSVLVSAGVQQSAKPVLKVVPPPHVNNPWNRGKEEGGGSVSSQESSLQSLHTQSGVTKR